LQIEIAKRVVAVSIIIISTIIVAATAAATTTTTTTTTISIGMDCLKESSGFLVCHKHISYHGTWCHHFVVGLSSVHLFTIFIFGAPEKICGHAPYLNLIFLFAVHCSQILPNDTFSLH
jgi:ABC-type amino acid transport system permease subunit